MLNLLLGSVTLIAIFLHFMNMGSTLGTVCGVVSTAGLMLKTWMSRSALRASQG